MRPIRLNFFLIAFVFLNCVCVFAKITFAQYNIAPSVIGNGGTALAGTMYSIAGTVGQLAPGSAGNAADSVDAGFWYLQIYNVTGVKSPSGRVAKNYELNQNYPNPFNPTTVISYQLPEVSKVTLKVFDVLGREVATLVDEKENVGSYSVRFDGSRLASGVYFYQLRSAGFASIKKMLMVK